MIFYLIKLLLDVIFETLHMQKGSTYKRVYTVGTISEACEINHPLTQGSQTQSVSWAALKMKTKFQVNTQCFRKIDQGSIL